MIDGDRGLEWPRKKPRWIVASLAYRLILLAVRVMGRPRVMRMLLDTELLSHRFAFEQANRQWGESFSNRVLGMNSDLLRQWVPKGASVIDLGCGDGRGCRLAAAADAGTIVGLDYDAASIAAAARKTPGATFVVADITRPLSDQLDKRFDVALLLHVIEHIEDATGFLSSLHAVARRLIIEVPDVDANWSNVARRELGARLDTDDDHVREYTSTMLRAQLTAAGWNTSHLESRRGVLIAVADPA